MPLEKKQVMAQIKDLIGSLAGVQNKPSNSIFYLCITRKQVNVHNELIAWPSEEAIQLDFILLVRKQVIEQHKELGPQRTLSSRLSYLWRES